MIPFYTTQRDGSYGFIKICCDIIIDHTIKIPPQTVRPNVVEKNSERVRNLRNLHVTRLLDEGWRRQEMIFIDECSFNCWMRCHRGVKKLGKRLQVKIPNSRGANISLVLQLDQMILYI